MAMVNYLCRHGIVRPAIGRRRGRGIQRKFSFGDIVVLKAMAKLLAGGVSVTRLKRALVSLRAQHPSITQERVPGSYLVTDGKEVLLRHKSGVVELLATGQFSFAFVIELDAVRREAIAFAAGPRQGDRRTSIVARSGTRARRAA